jgi:hypothetical protein
MNNITETIVTIATAIVGVAILAVLVSRNANTSAVIQAAGSAFSNALGVATAPVTGAKVSLDTSYPGNGSFFSGMSLPGL